MNKTAQHHRLLWMTMLVILAFFCLGWRLVDLQHGEGSALRLSYQDRQLHEVPTMPWRGRIFDRDGVVLALSLRSHDIAVDPSILEFEDRDGKTNSYHKEVARLVAPFLPMDEHAIAEKITPHTWVDADGKTNKLQFVPLARQMRHEQYFEIKEAIRNVGADDPWSPALNRIRTMGVFSHKEVQTRRYPTGTRVGPLLGLVNERDPVPDERRQPAQGVSGLEQIFDGYLAGVPGYQTVLRTELMDQLVDDIPVIDGMNLVTTIQRRVQEVLDDAVSKACLTNGAAKAFGMVMNVNTFEIYAVSSAPSFDPNDRSTYHPDLAKVASFTEVFEPGSIMKSIPIAAALEEGLVTLDTTVYCENGYWPQWDLEDTHRYEDLSVAEVMKVSSNIGTAKIAALLGPRKLYDYIVRFGVGSRTGVGLYEESGLIHPYAKYRPVDFTRLPIGYASAVTQLQMACIYSAIANGGVMMQPRIVKRVQDNEGRIIQDFSSPRRSRVLSPAASADVMSAMMAVTEPGGTATRAALDYYTVAGKTGTARKAIDGAYVDGEYVSTFIGTFPATRPQICVVITVDRPDPGRGGYYGGTVAAPWFAEVGNAVGRILNLDPDKTTGDVAMLND